MDGEVNRISLRSLLADAEFVGADDICVGHSTDDPRACRDGDVFVAPADPRIDLEEAVATALRLGARAVVASRPIAGCTVPVCYVPDVRDALGRICQASAGEPSRRLKTIGVAGSFGKTTTGYLIASVLSEAGRTPGVIGSLGYADGRETADARWTTPPPTVLAGWLRRMAENDCTHAVIEVSGRGLAESRTAGVEFDAVCLTNVRRGNDRTRCSDVDRRRYLGRLIRQLNPEGLLVVNADDPGCGTLVDEHDGPCVTIGLEAPAEITASIVEQHRSEQTFILSFGREVIPVRTTLLGGHNVLNCLSAAAVASGYGISPDVIVRGLESVRELPGRLERIECGQPFGVFVDEAQSPEALDTALRTLRATGIGRLFCVLSPAPEHDRTTRTRFGLVADEWCDQTLVTAPPRRTFARPSLDDVCSGFHDAARRTVVDDRADAIRKALVAARPGDCVLIAGQGSETYSIGDREQDYWDDRQLCRQTLYSLAEREVPLRRAA
jgi:UDP-N-acetylmuramoyl-L-alanyl-D-glutamate--2,6-diaminopimelate ligase